MPVCFSARNSTTCDAIIQSVNEGLQSYDFEKKKDNVRILTGNEEGIYGWVSVNLMEKKIGRRKVSELLKDISFENSMFNSITLKTSEMTVQVQGDSENTLALSLQLKSRKFLDYSQKFDLNTKCPVKAA